MLVVFAEDALLMRDLRPDCRRRRKHVQPCAALHHPAQQTAQHPAQKIAEKRNGHRHARLYALYLRKIHPRNVEDRFAAAGNDGSAQAGGNPASYYTRIYYHPVTGEYIPGGWLYYMNPNVPWSVNFNYSYSYSRSYQRSNDQLITNHRHTQTLGVSGNVKLTPALSLQLTTNFDIMAFKMTTTQLSATYDLHCFNITFSWIPNGKWESWSFRIAANAAALADLLRFKKSTSYWDN